MNHSHSIRKKGKHQVKIKDKFDEIFHKPYIDIYWWWEYLRLLKRWSIVRIVYSQKTLKNLYTTCYKFYIMVPLYICKKKINIHEIYMYIFKNSLKVLKWFFKAQNILLHWPTPYTLQCILTDNLYCLNKGTSHIRRIYWFAFTCKMCQWNLVDQVELVNLNFAAAQFFMDTTKKNSISNK